MFCPTCKRWGCHEVRCRPKTKVYTDSAQAFNAVLDQVINSQLTGALSRVCDICSIELCNELDAYYGDDVAAAGLCCKCRAKGVK